MIAQPRIDDATAEALLTGLAVDAEFRPLAEMLSTCREMAAQPAPPSALLAYQMATGVFTDTAASVTARGRRRTRRPGGSRRRIAAFALAGGAAALVATASGVGFAGALPDQAQQRFEDVVESVTPLEVPGRGDPVTGDPGDPPPTDRDEFGDQVSDDAHDGGVDGGDVSERARDQGDHDQEQGDQPAPPGTSIAPAQPGGPPDNPGPPTQDDPRAEPDPPTPVRPTGHPAPPGAGNRPSVPPGG